MSHDHTPPEPTAPETAPPEAAAREAGASRAAGPEARPETPPARRRTRRSRLRRRLLVGLASTVVLVLGAAAGLLWLAAGRLVHPMDDTPLNTRVVASAPGTVTLPATTESRATGTYGLVWHDEETDRRHHGTLGPVLVSDDDTVTRELTADIPPAPGAKAKVIVTVWNSDPGRALGLDHQDVTYPGELGPMPAWFLPGTGTTWVIQVHGLGAGRAAGLRTMPQLHDLGHPVLGITYRNDPGAPRDSGNTRHFGDTEWRDLDAAVRYARDHGATGVVLLGHSMGGGIVETYLQRAADTSAVRAVVLDSPALDYRATLDTIVTGLGLPAPVAALQAGIVGLRADVDLDDVDALAANRRTGGPKQPVLLFHGTGDTVVPYATSAAFAHDWPDKVRLVTVEGATHTGAWNADPGVYAEELAAFLAQHT
ncbi:MULTISPECIES: alpha/beta hydrolase [unclassified Streptomyces]|uniref:alpha/beta hydrolase n=1 Tax=unclassified Streptomyces TaxID=2593676 RepID=UPI0037FE9115